MSVPINKLQPSKPKPKLLMIDKWVGWPVTFCCSWWVGQATLTGWVDVGNAHLQWDDSPLSVSSPFFFCRTEMASAAELSLLVQRLETVASKLESTVLGAQGSTTTMPGIKKLLYISDYRHRIIQVWEECRSVIKRKKKNMYNLKRRRMEVTPDIWRCTFFFAVRAAFWNGLCVMSLRDIPLYFIFIFSRPSLSTVCVC